MTTVQLNTRVPAHVRERLRRACLAEGVHQNHYVERLIEAHVPDYRIERVEPSEDERGAAGIDDASHATGTVRAARRSPRNCA